MITEIRKYTFRIQLNILIIKTVAHNARETEREKTTSKKVWDGGKTSGENTHLKRRIILSSQRW